MKPVISIGAQDFEYIRSNHCFYIDKTLFLKEWWENGDAVTLITRPRRFGKTLNMSMTEQFFSRQYAGRGELFEGLAIWREDRYQKLQGSYPVLFLSFAGVKGDTYETAREGIVQVIIDIYAKYDFLRQGDALNSREKEYFDFVRQDMSDAVAAMSLHRLAICLNRYYGKKVIILLDEYDTPLQEAYIYGYWEKLAGFIQSLFNCTFKTNPYMERGLLTGITRISRESIFSDLNNLEVVTTTSGKYADSFGFTEEEVFKALEQYGFSDRKEEMKLWYDGFIFGNRRDIYNPWSVINYLDTGKLRTYWANTSSNSLAGKLIREGNRNVKLSFERLLKGERLKASIDEQIVYDQLGKDENAIWSLLLASGYLRAAGYEEYDIKNQIFERKYELELTNFEVNLMFRGMIKGWFGNSYSDYNDFVKAMLAGDVEAMNVYMNQVAQATFSSFDTGNAPSEKKPERFYHGFVLGLIVELSGRYVLTSNRESGFGRYDVMLEPQNKEDPAVIMEFKVFHPEKEKNLEDTVKAALAQIEDKNYEAAFKDRGIKPERICKYGFAFQGKKVLIGQKSKDRKLPVYS